MKLISRLLLLVAAWASMSPALGQIGLAAGFTGQSVQPDSKASPGSFDEESHKVWGTTLSAQLELGGIVRGGAEIRGTIARGGVVGVNSFGFGPRVDIVPPRLPFRVFGALLVGGAYVRTNASNKFTGRYLDTGGVIGLDLGISPRVDWRVLEYAHSSVSGEDVRNQFSTGVVFRFSELPSIKRHGH